MTPQLISVQGFAFAPAGLTCSAFPAGVFALPSNQLLEGTKQIKRYASSKKTNHSSNRLMNGSFLLGSTTFVPVSLS